jgi:hypothetical protein
MQSFLNVAVWVWLAEIFPLHMRGLGIGIAVFFGCVFPQRATPPQMPATSAEVGA